MSVPEVTVRTRRRVRAYTDVPAELRSFMEERGLRLSWQREGDLSMLYSEGIEAVNVNQLGSDLQELLKHVRMKANQDGVFARGTVVLCSQPLDQYEAGQAEYEAISLARQERGDLDALDQQIKEQLGLGGISNPPGLLHHVGASSRPADFVRKTPPTQDDQ